MMRLVFMGSDAIALPLLNWLVGEGREAAKIVGIFCQPDRAAGRGQRLQPGALKLWAEGNGLPVHQPEKLGTAELAQLQAYRPDVALVMAYGHILRAEFISAPRLGTLNLHASMLPKYRGASPIQTAVACGETETGVTLMRIVPELDAGPVAAHEPVVVGALDTAGEVENKLSHACVALAARGLPELAAGRLTFVEQEGARATFCRRLEREDGRLDFTAPASVLAARVNGLFPWPACSVRINGQEVKLGLADALTAETCPALGDRFGAPGAAPGIVLGTDPSGLLVGTGRGVLRLRKLQRPGGKMLAAADFLRGFPVPDGAVLPSTPMPPLVARAPFPRKKS